MELIHETDTHEFVKKLPELDYASVHLQMLTTRSRKAKEILGLKIKDLVLERRIIRWLKGDWRDRYRDGVRNMALLQQHGYHKVFADGKLTRVPLEAMAIIGTVCPRDVVTAAKDTVRETIDTLWSKDAVAMTGLARLNVALFSSLHRHKVKAHHFVCVDIDSMDKTVFKGALDRCSVLPIWMVTEVSRGWHIILDLSNKHDAAAFYKPKGVRASLDEIWSRTELEVLIDPQEPVPGTLYYRESGQEHYVTIVQ